MYKLPVLAAFLMLQSPQLNADSLQITLASRHFSDGDFTEVNPGLIYEKDLTKRLSFIAGGYRNSYDKLSLLAGVEAQSGPFGVQGGVATGYGDLYGHKLQPTGTLFFEVPVFERAKVRFSVIPTKHGATALSVIIPLNDP